MQELKDNYDTIIVGGGPSGSACAIFLSRYGHDVLLVDKAKFPRDKPCGDGITGKSAGILKELNLIDSVKSDPHEIYNGAVIYVNNFRMDVNFDGFYGFVSKRLVFDNILFQEAKKKVTTFEGFAANGVIFENGRVVGVKGVDSDTKKEREFRAKIVVGADGANSVVAREVGLNEFKPSHHASALRVYYKNIKDLTKNLEVYFFENVMPGYFWIFPLENNMANVGIGMSTSEVQKRNVNLQELMFKEIKNNPILADRFKNSEIIDGTLRGWNLPLATARRKMYGNGFVLLGDAASLIDPFTGEGIGNGLVSAKLAAQFIDEAIRTGDYSEKALKKYQDEMWKLIGGEIKYSFLFAIAGKFKWLLNRAFKKISNDKKFQELVTMSLVGKEKHAKVSFWTGLRLLFKLIF